ncbi:hypothetical protein [Thalassoroseus pseudoceratinae]|uniref:hypothetical protein n=1 Tax=Thalassoroseus pseudoceratinae TaxID=2713176 RepID=UPI00141F911D|nr:hypothetical protein [Thalassoroseus pseudoceratinae]
MNYDEARHLLLVHGSGFFDQAGEPIFLDTGFCGMLRPYRGLIEGNFHVVMEALLVVGERIHNAEMVDRPLIESLWSTSSSMRFWGIHPDGMLQRNNLITPDDTRRLETWIDVFERTALGLLRGCPPYIEVERYAQYVIDFGPGDNISFFIPLMIRLLDNSEIQDPTVVVEALGLLGPIASDALPSLRAAANRTYPNYCNKEARELITDAIRRIQLS